MKKITNREYKMAGAFTLVVGTFLLAVSLGFLGTSKPLAVIALIALSAMPVLFGLISLLTKPIRSVLILGPASLVIVFLTLMIVRGILFPEVRKWWNSEPRVDAAIEEFKTEYTKGRALKQRRDWDSAIACYTQAIQLVPDDISDHDRVRPNIAIGYSSRGLAYNAKKEYDKAIEDFTEAIRIDAAADSYKWRGEAYTVKKEYDKAIADFTEAIQMSPRAGAELYLGRARAYSGKGDTANARNDSAKATRLMLRN